MNLKFTEGGVGGGGGNDSQVITLILICTASYVKYI